MFKDTEAWIHGPFSPIDICFFVLYIIYFCYVNYFKMLRCPSGQQKVYESFNPIYYPNIKSLDI